MASCDETTALGIALTAVQQPPSLCYLRPKSFFACAVKLVGTPDVQFATVRVTLVYADTAQPVGTPHFSIRGVAGCATASLGWESAVGALADGTLRLQVRYNECTSRHQHRRFALQFQVVSTLHPGLPLVMGSTLVKTRKPADDAPVLAKVRTAEELADARQRVAEERGEVCDLTGEEPPAKQAKH
jgi:hypothetical protein